MSGEMIDFRDGAELVASRTVLERLLEWTAPARVQLGIEVDLPERNGAERARESIAAGASIEEVFRRGGGGDETDLHCRYQRA